MSANYQYSRILLKRTTETGATPTINTGSTDHTDQTWTPYDIYPGEFYVNIVDDRMWVGTLNGVKEIAITGGTGTIISGTSMGGGFPVFNDVNGSYLRFNSLSAGTNFSISNDGTGTLTLNSTGGGGGGNVINGLNTYTAGTSSAQSVNISAATLSSLSVTGNTVLSATSANTVVILNSGASTSNLTDWVGNTIRTGVTNSTIAAGSGNTINNNLRNVFVAGSNLTADTSDTAYFNSVVSNGINVNACDLSLAFSDETTQITTGSTKATIYAPYGMTITAVHFSLSQSGSALSTFNVRVNGTSIFSTRPTIDANEFHTSTAATPAVITASTVSAFQRITVDVDGIGTGCAGGKVYILGNRTS